MKKSIFLSSSAVKASTAKWFINNYICKIPAIEWFNKTKINLGQNPSIKLTKEIYQVKYKAIPIRFKNYPVFKIEIKEIKYKLNLPTIIARGT